MVRLASMLYSIIATALGGALVVVALTTGNDQFLPILVAAAIGAVLAVPVAYYVAREIMRQQL